MIQALSLDFWGTVARFNPAYRAARSAYFAGLAGISEAAAHARYQFVKHGLDREAERLGAAVIPLTACERLLEHLRPIRPIPATEVLATIESLVRAHPPIITARTAASLTQAADAGLILVLASNTNFIGGSLLNELFAHLPFHGRVYSDEAGASKPHPEFFRTLLDGIRKHRPGIVPGAVTHLGDHEVCDIAGAERAGMTAVLVRSPAETAPAVERIVATFRETS